jgi:hypothetical protein
MTKQRFDKRRQNFRTGLILGVIALGFFVAVILKHIFFG